MRSICPRARGRDAEPGTEHAWFDVAGCTDAEIVAGARRSGIDLATAAEEGHSPSGAELRTLSGIDSSKATQPRRRVGLGARSAALLGIAAPGALTPLA